MLSFSWVIAPASACEFAVLSNMAPCSSGLSSLFSRWRRLVALFLVGGGDVFDFFLGIFVVHRSIRLSTRQKQIWCNLNSLQILITAGYPAEHSTEDG